MEQNPEELAVPDVVEEQVTPPKRAKKRVPKKALEQIERAQRESEAQPMKEIENEESARGSDTVVIQEPEPVAEIPSHQVLKCECGCDIMPKANGMYPARCPECGTWNDYRGVKFLEQSANILVCDKCGGLTLITPETVCCEHCGAH